MSKLAKRLQIFRNYQPLLAQLVTKDIKLKYRRSFLGYLWSILNPLLIMMIMVTVFSNMFRYDIVNYPVYLIIGQTIYGFVNESTNQAMFSIVGNAPLLKKTYVPKYIFTFSKVTSALINMIFSMGAMLIVFVLSRVRFTVYMMYIPIVLMQVYLFCIGLGLFLAQATVFFRDIQYIYAAFMTAWVYLTPIFYPIEQLPENLQIAIKVFNPLYSYVTQFRILVLEMRLPQIGLVLQGIGVALIMVIVGSYFFVRTQDKFILYI